jgi:hypothetical protein
MYESWAETKMSLPLSTLGSDKRTLPSDGFDVRCHAAPASYQHFAVVEVASEDPPGSPPLVRVSLRTVDLEWGQDHLESGRDRRERGHVPGHARVRSCHPIGARGQGM